MTNWRYWIGENYGDMKRFGAKFLMRHWALLRRQSIYSVHVRNVGDIAIRANSSDLHVVRQTFGDGQYSFDGLAQGADIRAHYEQICAAGQTPLIIDAGANIGTASIWFADRFPQARVIAIEPEPGNAGLCRLNTATRANIEVLEAAIGATPGHVQLSGQENSWGVRTERIDSDVGVRVYSIPEIMAGYANVALFIAKIDVEGFESDLFSANTDWLNQVKAVFIEPHDWMLPKSYSSRTFQAAMTQHPFELLIVGENLLYVQ